MWSLWTHVNSVNTKVFVLTFGGWLSWRVSETHRTHSNPVLEEQKPERVSRWACERKQPWDHDNSAFSCSLIRERICCFLIQSNNQGQVDPSLSALVKTGALSLSGSCLALLGLGPWGSTLTWSPRNNPWSLILSCFGPAHPRSPYLLASVIYSGCTIHRTQFSLSPFAQRSQTCFLVSAEAGSSGTLSSVNSGTHSFSRVDSHNIHIHK